MTDMTQEQMMYELKNRCDPLLTSDSESCKEQKSKLDLISRQDAPSADRPKGEWKLKGHLWECDNCGCRINRANPLKGNIWNYNFCPNCGADMRGDTDDDDTEID